ncbi:MAG: hypothetical protein Q8R45_09765, partial [Brevundimonas sp.]|nr:hypothetical protein [Brevundimonas sp.]
MIRADTLITDCRLATMVEGGEPYGAIEDGAILIRDGRIVWAGSRADLPGHEATQTDRLDGRWVTPGLVDCHRRPGVLPRRRPVASIIPAGQRPVDVEGLVG